MNNPDPAHPASPNPFSVSVPRATYRLQLNKDFCFRKATALVPYLARLGISHLYLSPILKARPGSSHGYDVTDHGSLNPELGTIEEFKQLAATAHAQGLGLIVDFVPNHMAIMADDNVWWLDVLENGPAAEYAPYFDIDWLPLRASMAHRLLVPVLGEPYGKVLDKGDIALVFDPQAGAFALKYYQHRFPLDPRDYPRIFAPRRAELKPLMQNDPEAVQDFESLLEQFGRLPPRDDLSETARSERYRDKEVHKRRLAALYANSAVIVRYIDEAVLALNGAPGRPDSFDHLHALIEAQAYRLAYWRVAGDEINYRRFFDVDHLAALRMDDARVFEATHRLIFQLVAEGNIDGLRIDHPDGLYDPQRYLERLQEAGIRASGKPSFYVVVEKILANHERLDRRWPVAGTTGYDFAALVNAWLTDGEGEHALTRFYQSFTRNRLEYEEIVYQSKKLVMKTLLAAEIAVLSTQLDRLAQQRRYTADFTRYALRDALIETIACFPVYRSYISERGATENDARYIEWALQVARRHSQAADLSVFDFVRQVLLEDTAAESKEVRPAALEFAMKFQQVTAAITAKGIEDTAFYRYGRLVSLNEVGGSPLNFSLSNASMHAANLERMRQWPHALLGTSTHDSKRSEDLRARLAVLSELPQLWRKHLARWNRLNRSKRQSLGKDQAPSREDEYLLYQTLIGIWPIDEPNEAEAAALITRLEDYAIKAAREAKDRSSWVNQNALYEQALRDFLKRLLERPHKNAFLRDLGALANHLAYFGLLNGLSQTALKFGAPGVPDVYQGMERPQFSLVDPDNRRPVPLAQHEALLRELENNHEINAEFLSGLLQHWRDGRSKLFLTWRLLRLRAQAPALFEQGHYEALNIEGAQAERVIAFMRRWQQQFAVFIVPRHMAKLSKGELKPPLGSDVWENTRLHLPEELQGKRFRDLISGCELDSAENSSLEIGTALRHFPIAVLMDAGEHEWWAGWGSNPRQTP